MDMVRPRQGSRKDAGELVVEAALAGVRTQGLSVALDQISLEQAIAASGVARATAYRRWPNRIDFQREVLLRVARDVRLEAEGEEEIAAILALVQARSPELLTEEGRRTLVVESFRLAAVADFARLAASRAWRDHLALRATWASLPAGQLRDTVGGELRAAEERFERQRARVYARLPAVIGYRLRPWLDPEGGFRLMSDTVGALMVGLVIRSGLAPARDTFRLRAFGATIEAEWTAESYGLVSGLLAYLEPDPDIVWDQARVDAALRGSQLLVDHARSQRAEDTSRP